MPTKRIVCLANSRKLHGRCVAGPEVGSHPPSWIRPVSARPSQEVSEYERQYADGRDPQLLDVIDIPLVEHQPHNYQQENWLLDWLEYWSKVDIYPWRDLQLFSQPAGTLWLNNYHTTSGRNDRIPLIDANGQSDSLRLIQVDHLRLRVFAPGEAFGNSKRRVQAGFEFAGVDYALWVTDPTVERRYLRQDDGSYEITEKCYLTISLGEPWNDWCYKLVAAVLRKP